MPSRARDTSLRSSAWRRERIRISMRMKTSADSRRSALLGWLRIRRSVLVRVVADLCVDAQIDVGIVTEVAVSASPDFEASGERIALVDEMVSVRRVFRERHAIAGPKNLFARIRHQRQFAREHVDEFVFRRVP